MAKSCFLTYGANNIAVDNLGQRIARALGMEVQLRESLYRGEYVNCIGPQADTLTISPNEVAGEVIYEQFKEYSVLIDISNTKGKNVDKEARTSEIKRVLATMPELVLLKDKLLEE